MTIIPGPLRRGFEALLEAPVQRLIAARVSPNLLTSIGTGVLVGGGVAFAIGRVRIGAALLLLSGVFDMLDGRVARGSGGTTTFGAFYDSTLDRIGEAALFLGIALYFLQGGVAETWVLPAVAVAVIGLAASLVVSYARARAEGLGLDCKVGLAQRAERILGLGAPTLFFGAGPDGWLLLGIVILLTVVALITVGQRILHVYRITRDAPRPRATEARKITSAELLKYSGRGPGGQ